MKAGDKVKAGDSLMVMIAMKMEVSEIMSPVTSSLWKPSGIIVPYVVS